MKSVKGNFEMAKLLAYRWWYKPVVALLCFVTSLSVFAQNIPTRPDPPTLVNDFAHMMSEEQVQTLERKLDAYSDTTSTQIVVVTIETLDGAEVGSFGAELLQKWGVGTKKNHNGVVIVLAKKEHKVTIRTGYGVEEKLGAIICDGIIKNRLDPNFKNNNFYGGFDAATDEMIERLAGTYQGTGVKTQRHGGGIPLWRIIAIILFFVVILPIFFRGGGGGGTFGGGGFTGGLIGGMIGGSLGGGGYGGGGGGDGGGFGGFGGGEASGGGASGDW
jgi:uncharacterized protein